MKHLLLIALLLVIAGLVTLGGNTARAGEVTPPSSYKVLDPIRHGNLTVFPVVAAKSYPTGEFLTLDEGLHSGEVVVTEAGSVRGLVRRHGQPVRQYDSAEVNRLVLVNNSKRPLLLLAGEVVSGGKQDRVIGKDRIVPPESDPIDLSVFCVEHGRWVASSEHFGASQAMYGSANGGPRPPNAPAPMAIMVQPSVRGKAMGDKNQQEVWDEVSKQKVAMAEQVTVSANTAPVELDQATSYAKVNENQAVRKQV